MFQLLDMSRMKLKYGLKLRRGTRGCRCQLMTMKSKETVKTWIVIKFFKKKEHIKDI